MPSVLRLLDEGVQSIVAAAAHEGINISAKTGIRWSLAGIRGIKLESLKVCGQRMTSRDAFRRFVAATQDQPRVVDNALDRGSADKVLGTFGLEPQSQLRAGGVNRAGVSDE